MTADIAVTCVYKSNAIAHAELLTVFIEEIDTNGVVLVRAFRADTLKKRDYTPGTIIANIYCANITDMREELFRLVEEKKLNIGRIDILHKCFFIHYNNITVLQKLIEVDLDHSMDTRNVAIETSFKITSIPSHNGSKQSKIYIGHDVEYCKETCHKWNINRKAIADINNNTHAYKNNRIVILHKTKEILCRYKFNGKEEYKPIPRSGWLVDCDI